MNRFIRYFLNGWGKWVYTKFPRKSEACVSCSRPLGVGGGWVMMGNSNEAIERVHEAIERVSGGDIHVGSRKER